MVLDFSFQYQLGYPKNVISGPVNNSHRSLFVAILASCVLPIFEKKRLGRCQWGNSLILDWEDASKVFKSSQIQGAQFRSFAALHSWERVGAAISEQPRPQTCFCTHPCASGSLICPVLPGILGILDTWKCNFLTESLEFLEKSYLKCNKKLIFRGFGINF